jgi:cytochrome c1
MSARGPLSLLAAAAAASLCACEPAKQETGRYTGSIEAGRAALQAYDCGVCHRIPGVRGATGRVGPPLAQYGKRIYVAGRFPNTEPMLVRWIMDPPALERATAMPSLGVSEQEARDMAAYLLSLR